ncbi:hypothetical protein [Natrarchaeobaculum aegyptiacum]|uniref:Small CPxCG-related zinc finger protein n=1 Tax=Natrarchaeobaculum aegyptiacum TaxID=745377 RepID=A0A2Z2HVB0_9EURY|nr:hypothetical protein [Natrarchaeobaculum aegyptiacum]ARS91219.1 hypothetical protein B1756_16780 [Natrarchaeobaculum aegyptiacum]
MSDDVPETRSGCFWADDPFELPEYGPDVTPCPRCGTPITHVTSTGPLEHVAIPCGCPAPGELLEQFIDQSEPEREYGEADSS